MQMQFRNENGALVFARQGEKVRIEPWGPDALRVRATLLGAIQPEDWALTETPEPSKAEISLFSRERKAADGAMEQKECASIQNGRLRCEVNHAGVLSFYRDGALILREYYRFYDGTISRESRCLKVVNREWKGVTGGGEFALTVRFEPNDGEKLFGMGQYQQPWLDLKGTVLELMQRNSQTSVPFCLSSLGYGLLWNNPAVGRVSFAKNLTEWTAQSTRQMDYWIAAGENPKQLLCRYTAVTGRAPLFPDALTGLWQCKLRYRTQQEVLEVARRYQAEGMHLDQIVIDFFHWPLQGDWCFDKAYWPDPKAMVDELHAMGTRVIVSIWPSVDKRSEHYAPMLERGLLMRTERGAAQTYDYQGDCVQVDVFNPEARAYLWEICKKNYYDLGIDGFWLDNSEPDLCVYDFEHYRYCDGPALRLSNLYPQWYSRTFYDPMARLEPCPVNLLRCGWAGSQKYGNVLWSGDIPSTFEALRDQLQCGLNMGLAGIPWWTTDIGGFMTDDVNDPDFRQLLIRWFQFAVYSPVLRMHGDRGPYNIPPLCEGERGGGFMRTGQPNELWSYGEEVYRILRKFYDLRLSLRGYVSGLYREAHENGSPILRAMFYEFPDDPLCWELDDQYMFGSRYLVAPILRLNQFEREVYLPAGQWKHTSTGRVLEGARRVRVQAPLDEIPVFERL